MDNFNTDPSSFNPDALIFSDMPFGPEPHAEAEGTDTPPVEPAPTRRQQRRQKHSEVADTPAEDAQPQTPPADAPQPKTARKAAKQKAREHTPSTNWLMDARVHTFIGITLMIAVVYLLIVTISYFTTIVHDQSLVLSNTLPGLVDQSAQVRNAGGPLGAWLSERLISGWMGVGTFILIAWLGLCSLRLLKVSTMRFWPLTLRCFFSAVALSVIVGFATYHLSSPIFWGGMHGHNFVAAAEKLAGIWGALGVCIILGALVVLMFINPLRQGWHTISEYIHTRMQQRAEQRAQRRAEREAELAELAAARVRAAADADEAPEEEEEEADAAQAIAREAERREQSRAAATIKMEAPVPVVEMPQGPQVTSAPNAMEAPGPIPTIGMTIETPEVAQAAVIEEPKSAIDDVVPYGKIGSLYDPRYELSDYTFPTLDLLNEPVEDNNNIDVDEQEGNKAFITSTLQTFGIELSSIKATVGPTVTLYEVIPAEGVPIARIKRLEDDIALRLAALGIRIAPVPGKGTIGIEVPNKRPRTVAIRTVLGSQKYQQSKMELPMALGCTIENDVFMVDLAKIPHLLVAGATGMGKSVGLNTIIASLIYKKHPAELKFVFVDPKMVELSLYRKLERHYLAKLPEEDNPIITEPSKAVGTLNSLCLEMDNRYALLMAAGERGIKDYNAKFIRRELNPNEGHRYLPYIVVVVDEYGDLMLTAGKEIETPISRIAAKARAVGIHMILATQRPSVNVVTSVIKANFPGRMAFRVQQRTDSSTILDRTGANQLIGRGDMLFSNSGVIERVQCAFIDTPEVNAICDFINAQQGYPEAYELPEPEPEDANGDLSAAGDRDSRFEEIARYVVLSSTASTSNIQRKFSLGYNRAGKIMDQLEAAGIVGPASGSKPRSVLMDSTQLERLLSQTNS